MERKPGPAGPAGIPGPKPLKPPAKEGWRAYVYTTLSCVAIFGLCLWLLRGCYQSEWDRLRAENDRLEDENRRLKEGAQLADQHCQDLLAQNQCAPAVPKAVYKRKVAAVVPKVRVGRKFKRPAPALANRQQEAVQASAKREAPVVEDEPECGGEPIDYASFYNGVHTGLPVGKRFCFKACISRTPCIGGLHDFNETVICNLKMDFDDQAEQEGWVKTKKIYCGQIVGSYIDKAGVSIHRLH